MKNLFILLCFISLNSNAQIRGGMRVYYSTQYHVGIGAELGYLINDILYTGLDASLFPFNQQTNRSEPAFKELTVALKLKKIQPFLRIGLAGTGSESLRNHEGFRSTTYGGGISYIVGDFAKIGMGVRSYKIKGDIEGNSQDVLKPGNYLNGIISFSFGVFN